MLNLATWLATDCSHCVMLSIDTRNQRGIRVHANCRSRRKRGAFPSIPVTPFSTPLTLKIHSLPSRMIPAQLLVQPDHIANNNQRGRTEFFSFSSFSILLSVAVNDPLFLSGTLFDQGNRCGAERPVLSTSR